jgi:hypothetical protein
MLQSYLGLTPTDAAEAVAWAITRLTREEP